MPADLHADARKSPRVAGLATAVPPNLVTQAEAKDFARGFFGDALPGIDRLLTAFGRAGIERRHLARPPEWYVQPRSFPEKNEVYQEAATALAEEAAEQAIERSGIDRRELGSVVFVSTTGIAKPTLDGRLIQRLGLAGTVHRAPLWGFGCAGGAAGLAHAATLVRGTGRPALLVSVELCSVTFMHGDRSKANLIATALFGDGAAAAVVALDGEGPLLLRGHSHLLEDSEDVMGWSLEPNGLRVVFSRHIPTIVHDILPSVVDEATAAGGLRPADLRHHVFHPGGTKVLDAFADALDMDPDGFALAREILRDYGNMSSPTVLFVLERFVERSPPGGDPGLLLALGPGFSAESVLFRW